MSYGFTCDSCKGHRFDIDTAPSKGNTTLAPGVRCCDCGRFSSLRQNNPQEPVGHGWVLDWATAIMIIISVFVVICNLAKL